MKFKSDKQRRKVMGYELGNQGMGTSYPKDNDISDLVLRDNGKTVRYNNEDVLIKKRKNIKPMDTHRVELIKTRPIPKIIISSPEDVFELLKGMGDYDREYAKIIHLGTKNQVVGIETISIGKINASLVHPREAMKGAILNNSVGVIFVHNHPSGDTLESKEDVLITEKLKKAFDYVGITLMDSVIIGKGKFNSFREGFLVNFT